MHHTAQRRGARASCQKMRKAPSPRKRSRQLSLLKTAQQKNTDCSEVSPPASQEKYTVSGQSTLHDPADILDLLSMLPDQGTVNRLFSFYQPIVDYFLKTKFRPFYRSARHKSLIEDIRCDLEYRLYDYLLCIRPGVGIDKLHKYGCLALYIYVQMSSWNRSALWAIDQDNVGFSLSTYKRQKNSGELRKVCSFSDYTFTTRKDSQGSQIAAKELFNKALSKQPEEYRQFIKEFVLRPDFNPNRFEGLKPYREPYGLDSQKASRVVQKFLKTLHSIAKKD